MVPRISLAAFLSLALAACATAPASPTVVPTAPPAIISKGMVSAADPRAAQAGVDVLRQGGNATDAAIAVMLALTVVFVLAQGLYLSRHIQDPETKGGK